MKQITHVEGLDIYTIVIMSLSVLIISRVVWIYNHQISKIFKEQELIINILYADLFWSLSIIVEAGLSLCNVNMDIQLLWVGIIQNFFLNVSTTFASLIAFCAYKTLINHQYLSSKDKLKNLYLIGYLFPLITSLIYFVVYLLIENGIIIYPDFMILGILDVIYPLACVCLSLSYYLRIQISFDRFILDFNARAEINTLFLFPLIILIFVLIPNLCLTTFVSLVFNNHSFSKTLSCLIIVLISTLTFPFYGIINSWAYGRCINMLDRKTKQLGIDSLDESIQITLLQRQQSQLTSYKDTISSM